MKNKSICLSLALIAGLALGGCQKKSEEQQAAPAEPAAPAAETPAAQAPAPAAAQTPAVTRQKAPEGAKVAFVGIKDGDTVTSPFKVGFSVEGLKVAPAGTTDPGTGHFHLIIDADLPPQDAPLPSDDHVKHYGQGQTEDELTLPPGPHTLQLEFTDGAHVPFDPPVVSDKINITVK
ncbi:MAG: DUF4399 domain-containing protein [Sinobacteraceae bacterium]|jgi:pyruvate/2-oxoglutarate dehydrogenase complex dihydrolipoamide acyltransferase (E2) component|nr:DUF4399 domain-containing protein [Nevskiaceae bacterium]